MEGVIADMAAKVVGVLCGVATMEISHMWNCSKNVDNCKDETDKLKAMKGRIEQRINLATSKNENLVYGVEAWVNKAKDEISKAEEFIKEADKAKKTFNLFNLYHYSRKAIKITSSLQKSYENCDRGRMEVSLSARTPNLSQLVTKVLRGYGNNKNPPTPGLVDLYQRKVLEDTQKSAVKEIILAIEDANIQIVGINGRGGVGKTTLALEVAAEMKNKFAHAVLIRVSKTIDAEMIQKEVQAATRTFNGEKVLIILDDVWEKLKLEEVGIPCGREGMKFKILLTSRYKDVCDTMNAQKNIEIKSLEPVEAWNLFERSIGNVEWDPELKKEASKIIDKCSGLPLLVQAVGKALEKKERDIWGEILSRLGPSTDEDTPFKDQDIMQLKLNYDYLESEVAKSCFLLCSMFPEDGIIGLKKLAHYSLALGEVNNSEILKAQDSVQEAVNILKSSYLFLSGNKEEDVVSKMHDLVRDMAMLIASNGKDKFWVQSGRGLRKWQIREDLKSYTKISLIGNRISKLPEHELLFPGLDTFLIQDNELSVVPDKFFQGMEKLKVLDMSANNISSLPQSLKLLRVLRLLDLNGNKSLSDISILGGLTCLEILKLRSTGVKEIPTEIGQLIKLRLLDVYSCESLSYVAPGVISRLSLLEEMYVELLTDVERDEFLGELCLLNSLKILHLKVPRLQRIPESSHFETLTEYNIGDFTGSDTYRCKRILRISNSTFPFTAPLMRLIQKSEYLELFGINDMNNILTKEGSNELKYIELRWCDNVTSLVNICDLENLQVSIDQGERETNDKFFSNVEEIKLSDLNGLEFLWDRPHRYVSCCHLTKIAISYCPSLKELFPLSVAETLSSLKNLQIENCESLVNVISAGSETEQSDGSEIELVKLMVISLRNLPNLQSFYSGYSSIKYPSLTSVVVEVCPKINRWSHGNNDIPNLNMYHHEIISLEETIRAMQRGPQTQCSYEHTSRTNELS